MRQTVDQWQHCTGEESAKVGAQMTYYMRKAQTGSFMHITLLLADQCSAASATLALEMLSAANLFAERAPFEIVVASLDGQAVDAWGGQRLQVMCSAAEVLQTDLILIPGFLFTLKEALPSFPAYGPWLRQQHAQGAVLASMCTAAFLLAETGMLQGLRATTHWAFAEFFRRRYADPLRRKPRDHLRWRQCRDGPDVAPDPPFRFTGPGAYLRQVLVDRQRAHRTVGVRHVVVAQEPRRRRGPAGATLAGATVCPAVGHR